MDERQHWSSRTAFILAAVGSAVGLGNVWRFPYVAYENGGGAFFIPYFAALISAGIPLMILEYGLGILYQKGAPSAMEQISSSFKWVGWVALLVGLTISFYYVPVIGWSWKYLVASPDLSWTKPTRNGTVFLMPYAKYESDDDLQRIQERLREEKTGGVQLIKEGEFDKQKQQLRDMWGDEDIQFFHATSSDAKDGGSDFRTFVRDMYEMERANDPPEKIRVLFLPYEHLQSSDPDRNVPTWLNRFYRDKLTQNRELREDFKWYPDTAPSKEVKLIKVKQNAAQYFASEVLGGYNREEWETENLLHRVRSGIRTHGGSFSPSHLSDRYFVTETPLSEAENASGVSLTSVLIHDVREGEGDWKQRAKTFYEEGAGLFLARFQQDEDVSFSDEERGRIADHLARIQSSGSVPVHFLDTLTPAFARTFGRLRHVQERIEEAPTPDEREAARDRKEGVIATLRTGLDQLISRRESFHGGQSFDARMGAIDWSLAFWTLVTWFLIFLIVYNGIDTVGKVVLWTVPLPVILLGALIVRGLMMPGAMDGLEHYLTPEWEQVAKPAVWRAAFSQVFFTLSLGFGIMIAYASYQSEDSDVVNNSFITSFANCATSFYAGFAVFSVMGGLAWALNQPVGDVMTSGPGLVFNVYPVALARLPMGGVWGVLFFLSLLMLGIDSAFSIVEAVVTGLSDIFENLPRQVIVTVTCSVGLIVSVLFFCRHSGTMWLTIMDHFVSGSFGLPLVGLLECVAVGLFFSTSTFRERVNAQSEIQINRWWDVFVQIIIPAVLLFLLWDAVVNLAPADFKGFHRVVEHSVLGAGWIYFAVLLFFAFLFGENWIGVVWTITGAVMLILLGLIPGMSWGMAVMTTIALLLLFGGFFTCLLYVESEPESEAKPAVD